MTAMHSGAQRTQGIVSQFAGLYREWPSHPSLRRHVRCLWINDLSNSPAESLQVVPDGCVDIVWTGDSLCVAGPDTAPVLTRPLGRATFVGVRFHPGSAHAWLGQPLHHLVNLRVPLAEFWHDDAARFLDRTAERRSAGLLAADLEALLIRRLAAVPAADPQLAFLRRAAGDYCAPARLPLHQLAADLGLSERSLRRRCLDAFGYGFKTLDRVLRFQRFFQLALRPENHNLAALALLAGYADQPHMTREVQRLSGATPGEFINLVRSRLADSFKTIPAGLA